MEEQISKNIYKAQVLKNEQVSASSYFLEMDLGTAVSIKAGQFLTICCEGLAFRRPFSVFSNSGSKIGILYKLKGRGTKYIKSLKSGDIIDTAVPLGNGFDIKKEKSLLIGAGIGIAPIAFLKEKLDELKIENFLAAGFLNKNEIPSNIEIEGIYTDDGSKGGKGSILNYIGSIVSEYKPKIIYACGPYIVLKTIAETGIRFGIETQTAMEKTMACGIGVCRGCVIEALRNGRTVNVSVCKDGPVFKGDEIVWQQ